MSSLEYRLLWGDGETCELCGAECGRALCESCQEDTEEEFRRLLGEFTPAQLRHISDRLDGVYLEDFLKKEI